ncbi:MAG: NAD(P)-binding domain-containing protein, partial [Rhodospirillaceae bacterium]|nr:NAD(P)-binding domain-containing protein [Rhodospirillaceae bacterium]
MRTVCVIGLGSMGQGAAASLLRKGFAVRGVDLREEALARLAAAGGTPCRTPAEGAQGAEAVLVLVVDAAQTDAVLFGEAGAVPALRPGAAVIASATVPPLYAEDLGARLAAAGVGAPPPPRAPR